MSSPTSGIAVDRRGAVGVIELARPEKLNALTRVAFDGIAAAVDEFVDQDVRAAVLRARGPHFCSGGDLREAQAMMGDRTRLVDFLDVVERTMRRLADAPFPVVAACQGYVLAGGLELALCADLVIASRDAQFGDQHIRYGLLPAWGGTQRLPRVVGVGRALDLMTTGRRVDASTAQRWGLVTDVVDPDDLHATAMCAAAEMAARSPVVLAEMKRLCRLSMDEDLSEGLRLEREAVLRVMNGPGAAQGLRAFEQRRAAR